MSLKVKTTVTLNDTPGAPETTIHWPADWFANQSLERLFYNATRVTIEKLDGNVIVYEPEHDA